MLMLTYPRQCHIISYNDLSMYLKALRGCTFQSENPYDQAIALGIHKGNPWLYPAEGMEIPVDSKD